MPLKVLLFLLACCLASPVAADDDAFTLYLVRHAEKQTDGGRDPALTKAGKLRAEQLATWLIDKGIKNIWSSDYQRTRDTALPLAEKLGLELKIYDPRNQPLLGGHLLARRHNALVVGHSNTIPELARMLCECEMADMDESEYERLIVISIDGGQIHTDTLNQADLF